MSSGVPSEGLHKSTNLNYLTKSRRLEIEGKDGDGTVTNWMDEWLQLHRIEGGYYRTDGVGICSHELYKKFAHDNLPLTKEGGGIWDYNHFDKMFFKYVMKLPEYRYNEHLSIRGDKKSDRKWLRGTAGNQTPHIRITSPSDPVE